MPHGRPLDTSFLKENLVMRTIAPTTAATALCAALLLTTAPATAVSLTNGDFETGDFFGWSLDTDGFPGGPADFSVVGSPGNFAGRIEADYWDVPGNTATIPLNDVFFANTLYQGLDTTAAPGSTVELSFDWTFDGQDGDPLAGEIFSVGLNDGLGNYFGADGGFGFLIDPTTTYGAGHFAAQLDPATYLNVPGWSLDVQLEVGVDPNTFEPNGFGSFVQIDNVALNAQTPTPPAVPEPSTLALLALGLAAMAGVGRHAAKS